MRKANLVLFIFLTFLAGNISAQDTTTLSKVIEKVVFFDADPLGHIYYSDQKNNFYKKDIFTKKKLVFTDLRSGIIANADVSNSLRVLLFYRDFMIIKFLDVNLSELSTYNIRENYREGNISLICASNNNGFWMYDENNRKLIRIGENFRTQQVSPDLYQVTGEKLNPISLLESGDELFMNDPNKGLLVFDLFGNYKKLIPLKGISYFRIEKDKIRYIRNNEIFLYDMMRLDNATIRTVETITENFIFYKEGVLYKDVDERLKLRP